MDGYNCTSRLGYTVKKVTAIFPSPAGMCYTLTIQIFFFSQNKLHGLQKAQNFMLISKVTV